MQTLAIEWKGERVEFKPSFELFMRIEDRVPFSRIAMQFSQAAGGNMAELPMTHVSWVIYCCLRHGGVVVNPDDVHQAIFSDKGLPVADVISGLLVAYYGATPEKVPKKKPTTPPASSRTSRRRSRSATG